MLKKNHIRNIKGLILALATLAILAAVSVVSANHAFENWS